MTVICSALALVVGIAAYYTLLLVTVFAPVIGGILWRVVRGHYDRSEEVRARGATIYMDNPMHARRIHGDDSEEEEGRGGEVEAERMDRKAFDRAHDLLYADSAAKSCDKSFYKNPYNTTKTIECAICLETHPLRECTQTACGHLFGSPCFRDWAWTCWSTAQSKSKPSQPQTCLRCPLCKKNVSAVPDYREQLI